jgi:hypothetical protein
LASVSRSQPRSQDFRVFVRAAVTRPVHPAGAGEVMTPQNENFARDVQALVLSMPVAQMLQLRFERIGPGEVDLCLPYQDSLSFRPGQLQATPVFAIADFAAVSAAGTLLPPGWLNATWTAASNTWLLPMARHCWPVAASSRPASC